MAKRGMRARADLRTVAHPEQMSASAAAPSQVAAVRMIHALDSAMQAGGDDVRFTVGRLDVTPNAPSVIAGNAIFSIDLRHVDSSRLASLQ